MASIQVMARENGKTNYNDTVYFYDSWERMLLDKPVAVFVNPSIEVTPPYGYEYRFEMNNDNLNDQIKGRFIAARLGGMWLLSSNYLRRAFKWKASSRNCYVHLYFNDKVAYVDYLQVGYNGEVDDFFYIDFLKRRLLKLSPALLTKLFDQWLYSDLQMRYQGLKNRKSRDVVVDFFFDFIDRATADENFPYITDTEEQLLFRVTQ